jgi:hypothetical protein
VGDWALFDKKKYDEIQILLKNILMRLNCSNSITFHQLYKTVSG